MAARRPKSGFLSLPDDAIGRILSHLAGDAVLDFARVCRRASRIVLGDVGLWEVVYTRECTQWAWITDAHSAGNGWRGARARESIGCFVDDVVALL
jgi:hypothetical protein